ncbi:MAG: LexA family transcriptional regulator [Bacteroidetes bacterium]|nr:LexA family transcriptional regulator [Bacteroidota bacterium]MBS1629349.1 LexA family transcriptional regulator [Bacteroidota bacterium]
MKKQTLFWSSNIKKLRERKKLSQEELAQKLGISRPKLNAHENGKTRNPPADDLINFSTFFGISVDTLLKIDLRKVGELRIRELEAGNDAFASGTKIRVLATTVDKANDDNVELVPEKAKAGYRSGYGDPEWIAELPHYTLPGLSKERKYRIFPITGDSMLPYPDGCYIVGEYVEDWLSLKDDTLCILILKSGGNDFVFKQVENRIKNGKILLAKSLNTLYQPYEVPVSDLIEVWKYRAHLADTITMLTHDVTSEQLLRMMQEMKIEISKLTAKTAA